MPARPATSTALRQRGMVLIASLLLLVVVTLLAVAMFRSMGIDARIAGNVREKQRALSAAMAAQQYAEFWLSSGSNSANTPVTCGSSAYANVTSNTSAILICTSSNIPYGPGNTTLGTDNFNPVVVPWQINGSPVGFSYAPSGPGSGSSSQYMATGGSGSNNYYALPSFFISFLGPAADGLGNAYQIDAVGYGGSANAVAVIESTYEVSTGVRAPLGQ